MNNGNIAYSNIIALSINAKGNVIAVSNNSEVQVYMIKYSNWYLNNTFLNASAKGLSLSQNGLKLGMGCGNPGEDFNSIIVKDIFDTTPNSPVLTLLGETNINHTIYTEFTEPGYTCIHNILGDLTENVIINSNLDTNVFGSYTITYSITDNTNNQTIKIRTIEVVDNIAPLISLTNPEITINQNTEYIDEGVTYSDNYDPNENLVLEITGTVDISTIGDYVLIYTITDTNGNYNSVSRLVHVIEVPKYTILWNDPTTEIMHDLLETHTKSTIVDYTSSMPYTISNLGVLNGNYCVRCSSYLAQFEAGTYIQKAATAAAYKLFDNSETFYNTCFSTWSYYRGNPSGDAVTRTIRTSDPYDATTREYVGNTSSSGNEYYSTVASNGETYKGEYVELMYEKMLQITRFELSAPGRPYALPGDLAVLGSNNNGSSWDFVTQIIIPTPTQIMEYNAEYDKNGDAYKIYRFHFQKARPSYPYSQVIASGLKIYGLFLELNQ